MPRTPRRRSRVARLPAPQTPAAAGSAAPRAGGCRSRRCSPRRDLRRLRLEVVGEARQILGTALGDQRQIFEAHAAEAPAVETRLDGDDIAGDELFAPGHAQARLFVHLEADAMAEAVEEAVLEWLVRHLRALGHVARRFEDVARSVEEGSAGD